MLVDNFRGGKIPRENNEQLVPRLAWPLMILGKIAEAKAALRDLRKYGLPGPESSHLKQELDMKYPNIFPSKSDGFRFGYLTVVFGILGVYVIAGMALFGGTSTAPTTPSQVTPRPTATIQPTPAPYIVPSPSLKSKKSDLLTQITRNKARLSEFKTQLDAIDTELEGYESRMDAILSRYPSRQLPDPYYSQYNDLVRQFNSRLASRNSLIKNYKDLLESTNTLIDQYNLTR